MYNARADEQAQKSIIFDHKAEFFHQSKVKTFTLPQCNVANFCKKILGVC